jgi:hypothetical protein
MQRGSFYNANSAGSAAFLKRFSFLVKISRAQSRIWLCARALINYKALLFYPDKFSFSDGYHHARLTRNCKLGAFFTVDFYPALLN